MNENSPVLGLAPSLPPPLRHWRWLTVPVAAERAAALRIAVAAILLLDLILLYVPNLSADYGPAGFGAAPIYQPIFETPHARWSVLRVLPASWGPTALFTVWLVATLGLLLGYRPRLAALACWICTVSFMQSNLHIHNGGDQLKVILLLMLIFLPSDGRWAIRRNPQATGPALIHPWPLRLLMLQLTIMYFMNGCYKALGPAWRDGSVMYYVANNPSWTHFSPNYLPLPDEAFRALAWITVIWELAFPVLVWMPLTRKATLWLGVLFHLGTLVHLEVGFFPLYALCFYVPLVAWERIPHGRVKAK